ncbi:NAD(P)-dependent alcohol dehydrogenase [Nonomuraea rhizosphaerae]|uniref:NAD(P)-dependent alcohol dehydrogenase n=1 Tax=Nonomuraea rhizosphaerae TaxID=2665663 RepID=UPI001C5FBBE8|nr:NAD(P)-dependent alcohol dehydrogenase [Nonomuraea rhizosphaerae]
MKAFVLRSYGSLDARHLTEIDIPAPGPDEVLIRTYATSVQPYDWHCAKGEPYVSRLMPGGLGLRKPPIDILGADVAGRVEKVGRHVTEFLPGDEVYAMSKRGGFAEYVCVRESELAPKPRNLSYEQAAAVPMAANTALIALRDVAQVQAGQKVLVNGASGGMGTFAVQLAKAFGAHVTGVCSDRNVDLVRSLGADEVVDYGKEDFTRNGQRYDVLIDSAGSRPWSAYRRVMTRRGIIVPVGGPAGRWFSPAGRMMRAMAMAPFIPQTLRLADVVACKDNKRNLMLLTGLIEGGEVTPIIGRTFTFKEIPEAVAYSEEGHATGKIVIAI